MFVALSCKQKDGKTRLCEPFFPYQEAPWHYHAIYGMMIQ
ncbi:hypothetical protein Entcl_4061 [[Enterobacter] lignolyticus SCF1]|uniref:Uncharacterized protein n=1 Tax=Enterobacter lignolyticus (strain SCF1) TaxID=701347 RepID=E3G1K9_ENTLS|nr:hypothetical protein Entcl_4061 [[Enterobacter] lignolyticus SCF1]